MFVKPTVNVIKPDIANTSIYLRSTEKWGKTTLFRDVILAKYNDPECGLVVEIGNEHGTTMLDNINKCHVDNFKDLVELKNWLIGDGKINGEHHIKIVAFDTTDELIPILEAEVVRRNNVKYPGKMCETINGAFNGFGEGQKMGAKLMKSYFEEIKSAGIQVWAIGHTKYKNIRDKANVDTEGYMQLTSNLESKYESALSSVFDIVLTGIVDRNIEVTGDGDAAVHKATAAIRKLYFRATPEIEAGGRFKAESVPEYMVFDKGNMASEFIKIVETGMLKSKTLNADQEAAAVKKMVEVESTTVECNDTVDDSYEIEVPETKEDLMAGIKARFVSANVETKAKVKEKLGGTPVADCSVEKLKEIYVCLVEAAQISE